MKLLESRRYRTVRLESNLKKLMEFLNYLLAKYREIERSAPSMAPVARILSCFMFAFVFYFPVE